MNRYPVLIAVALLVAAVPLNAQSTEQQVADNVRALYQALNDGNAAAWGVHLAPVADHHGTFTRTGSVLGDSPNIETMQSNFDAGRQSYDLAIHHLDVSAYGDTAVATFYTTGPSLLPSRPTIEGTFRVTNVWIRQGSEWKLVHVHVSRLEAG